MQLTGSFLYTDPRTDQVFTIWAAVTPGSTGQRHDGARFAEPDEPDEVQITAIYDELGNLIPLYTFTDSEIAAMDKAAMENAGDFESDND